MKIEIIKGDITKIHSDILEKVIFVCFDEENEEIYKKLLNSPF